MEPPRKDRPRRTRRPPRGTIIEVPTGIGIGPTRRRPRKEVTKTKVWKKVKLPQRYLEIIDIVNVDLPKTFDKLVTMTKTANVADIEFEYSDVFQGRIGPLGTELPLRRHKQSIRRIGDFRPPRRHPLVIPIHRQRIKPPMRLTGEKAKVGDFYFAPVTQEIREAVIEFIFDVVARRKRPILKGPARKGKSGPYSKPLIPGLVESKVETKDKTPPKKREIPQSRKVGWKQYYDRELRIWHYKKLYPKLQKKLPNKKREAQAEHRNLMDIEKILDDLQERYGMDLFNLDGQDFLKLIRTNKDLTALDAQILTRLSTLTPTELQELRGKHLTRELASIIGRYRQKFVPSVSVIQRRLEQDWISRRVSKIKITSSDKSEFRKEHMKALKETYAKYLKEYEKLHREKTPVKIKPHSKKGAQVRQQIRDMEEIMFRELIDPTLIEYLRKVLFPVLFLDQMGDIGRHAKFFQAKIKIGAIEIRALNSVNLAHYIPELVMKYISNQQSLGGLREAGRRIARDLKHLVDSFIIQFMSGKGIHIPILKDLPRFPWKHYLVVPQDVCRRDTGTGYVREKVKPFGSIERKIPDAELVICLTLGVGFSCHSIRGVIRDVTRGRRSSTTGQYYPEEFIKRIFKRYPDIVKSEKKEYERELEVELLFEGEEDISEGEGPGPE